MNTKYKHLNCEERTLIQLSLERECTIRAITRSLDRCPSSISRELARNQWCGPRVQPALVSRLALAGGYRAVTAHHRASSNRSRGRKPIRLASDGYLWSQVQKLLKQQYSPEQIAGILPRMFPDDLSMRVSHETIYTALYAMPRGELRAELLSTLRQARKARRPRARGEDRRGELPNMVSIHQRPPEIDERVIPGHWEGDLFKGRRNASSVGTIVELTNLFLTPPHRPWQRGVNKNTNGLFRQINPKRVDLSMFSQEDLDAVAWILNTIPRKSLGFKRPKELFLPYTFNADENYRRLVALSNNLLPV